MANKCFIATVVDPHIIDLFSTVKCTTRTSSTREIDQLTHHLDHHTTNMPPKAKPTYREIMAGVAGRLTDPTLDQNIKGSGLTLTATGPTAQEVAQDTHGVGWYCFGPLRDIYATQSSAAKDTATSSYLRTHLRDSMESQCPWACCRQPWLWRVSSPQNRHSDAGRRLDCCQITSGALGGD